MPPVHTGQGRGHGAPPTSLRPGDLQLLFRENLVPATSADLCPEDLSLQG